jgi:hypothetical protein
MSGNPTVPASMPASFGFQTHNLSTRLFQQSLMRTGLGAGRGRTSRADEPLPYRQRKKAGLDPLKAGPDVGFRVVIGRPSREAVNLG